MSQGNPLHECCGGPRYAPKTDVYICPKTNKNCNSKKYQLQIIVNHFFRGNCPMVHLPK